VTTAAKYKPKRGEIVVVPSIPPCNFCKDGTLGPYDFATRMGPWANGCEQHWKTYRASMHLGVGSGQLWITDDQIDYSDETPLQAAKRESREERRRLFPS
jgi:hypothetical protein